MKKSRFIYIFCMNFILEIKFLKLQVSTFCVQNAHMELCNCHKSIDKIQF